MKSSKKSKLQHRNCCAADYLNITTGGEMGAVIKAKEQGKIRHIGGTAHNLSMAEKLVGTGIFSTVQFTVNFIEDAAKDELHIAAREWRMSILAMKGFIDNAGIAFKFLRNHPDVIALPGLDFTERVD
jgi:uncharacterized protein